MSQMLVMLTTLRWASGQVRRELLPRMRVLPAMLCIMSTVIPYPVLEGVQDALNPMEKFW